MLTQKLIGTVINGVGAPVSGVITVTTFPNSTVGNDLIKKTVITADVGVDGKFVIHIPKFVECSVKITSGGTNVYSTVINVTNDDELDLSVYAADPPPGIADPFTLHMQDTTIHTPTGTGHTHDNKDALDKVGEAAGLPLWDGGAWPGASGWVTDHGALTGLSDDDHPQYSRTTHSHSGVYADALSSDDNYVTDAEKANLHAPHSDDQDLSGLLDETAHDTLDHTGLTGIPTAYSLPTASTTVLGGVKVDGTTVLISDGVISSTGGSGGGVTDHGLLTGLSDDDHTQYLNETRHDALDHTGLTGILALGTTPTTAAYGDHNHTGVYQPAGIYSIDIHSNITALNSVSGVNTGDQDLSGYSQTTHNHSLNNLTEKSYNSLTDKPSIPSITGLLDETAHDLLDHTGLTGIPAAYSLPTASTTVLGGVKVDGTTVTITDGVISSSGSGMTNPMATAGDIIIGGTNGTPTRLAKGTDGQLIGYVGGTVAPVDAAGGFDPLVAEYIVTGSPRTDVIFSGLDGNADGGYILEIDFLSNDSNSTSTNLYCYPNNATSNWLGCFLYGKASSASYADVTAPYIGFCRGTYKSKSVVSVFTDWSQLVQMGAQYGDTAYRQVSQVFNVNTGTTSNITSIVITASSTNGIAVGSTFRLYRRK